MDVTRQTRETSRGRMARSAKARRSQGMRPVTVWLPASLVAKVDATGREDSRKRPGQMAVLLREALAAREGAGK